jgi:hypothetical protein
VIPVGCIYKNFQQGGNQMIISTVRLSLVLFYLIMLVGCAKLNASLDAPMDTSLKGEKIVVFPFQAPYYKGRQIPGVGRPFAAVFVNKLQSAGVSASLSKSNAFTSSEIVNVDKACEYAVENGYDKLITGTVTEWLDGATQWSGTVDVAALTVSVYAASECELAGSASGRQNGQWFTFVDAPTTRFFEPLSENIVSKLVK